MAAAQNDHRLRRVRQAATQVGDHVQVLVVLQVALKALTVHKLRSFLTMLGVVIGVAAVIALVALGAGMQAETRAQFEAAGVNLLAVRPRMDMEFGEKGLRREPNELTDRELAALRARATSITAFAPQLERSGTIAFRGATTEAEVLGVTGAHASVRNVETGRGRFIADTDDAAGAMVVVLGAPVAEELFGKRLDPAGQTVRIDRQNYTVVGILKSQGDNLYTNQYVAYVPLRTAQLRWGGPGDHSISAIYMKVPDPAQMAFAEAQARTVLRALHGLPAAAEDDFMIQNQAQAIGEYQKFLGEYTRLLGSIAAISLLVGGIGIMNIMLVSVTERTREVGLRKAVGAKRRDILVQFLAEAIVLSVLGGLLGVGAGFGLARLAGNYVAILTGGARAIITPDSVLLALGVSVVIGVFFGLYPANRAAALNPIDALRYE